MMVSFLPQHLELTISNEVGRDKYQIKTQVITASIQSEYMSLGNEPSERLQ